MFTAVLQVIIYQLTKYERNRRTQSGKKKKKKEKTIQQQKGLPTLSADLNEYLQTKISFIAEVPPLQTVECVQVS